MKAVLLLIDLQNDFLATPDLQPNAGVLIRDASRLLNKARELNLPVVHVWTTVDRADDKRLPHWKAANRRMCERGTEGHAPPVPLQPGSAETVVHKSGFNAFAGDSLDEVLRKLHCDAVILAGVHLHTCVRMAATEALERQLKVFIAEDATGSNDPVHAAAVRRWLSERTVTFENSSALLQRVSGSSASLEHRSPLNSEFLFQVPISGSADIENAVSSVAKGWNQWRETGIRERAEKLNRLAELIEKSEASLAEDIVSDIGKPIIQAREELRRAAANVRDVVRRALEMTSISEPAGTVRREPVGVIALISPWNNPVAIPIGKIAPALAYGNVVVWKPAPSATRISQRVLELLVTAGVPDDAVRLVCGDHVTAQAVAAHSSVHAVTFTGSLAGGFALQEICSRRLIPLQAELSGNNAAIVWEDAGFDEAAAQIVSGAFGFSGQRCTANRRVIVPRDLQKSFVEQLRSAAEKMVLGDPYDERTEIGPMISTARRDEAEATVLEAADFGCSVLRTHSVLSRETWFTRGAYMQPAIICCEQPDAAIVQEESMAPILVVQPADDFDHAIQLANGVRHGLIAALFTHSKPLQKQFLFEARAGILKLNSATAGVDVTLPFGGWKASHVGPPEHGVGDVLFYTRMQALYGFTQPCNG